MCSCSVLRIPFCCFYLISVRSESVNQNEETTTHETALYQRQHFSWRIDVEKRRKNKTVNKKKKALRFTHEESNKEKFDDTETPTANKNQIYSDILFRIHTMQALMQRVQLKAKVKCVRLQHIFMDKREENKS